MQCNLCTTISDDTNTPPSSNGSQAMLLDKQHCKRQEAAHISLHGLHLIFKGLDTNEYTRKKFNISNTVNSFIHYIDMCRMWQFLAILNSFFHSSLLNTFSCHPSPPTILPSSFTSSCHLFLGLSLNLVVPKFIYNTLLGILFYYILCTYPNQCNLFNLIVSVMVGFLTLA